MVNYKPHLLKTLRIGKRKQDPHDPSIYTYYHKFDDLEDGDILEVQFTSGKPGNRTGISLTDQITIFCDASFHNALGFIAIAYSKLLVLPELPLAELGRTPEDIQNKVKRLIAESPLSHFLYLVDDKIGVEDVRMSELVAIG